MQIPFHAQPSLGLAPHPGDRRQPFCHLPAPRLWQGQGLSCHRATGSVCVQGLKQEGSGFFSPRSAASSPSEVLRIPGHVPCWLLRGHQVWLWCQQAQALPCQSLLWQVLGIPQHCAGGRFPVPCPHSHRADVACQPWGPHCRAGSMAECMVAPASACFMMAWPQRSLLQGAWGGRSWGWWGRCV